MATSNTLTHVFGLGSIFYDLSDAFDIIPTHWISAIMYRCRHHQHSGAVDVLALVLSTCIDRSMLPLTGTRRQRISLVKCVATSITSSACSYMLQLCITVGMAYTTLHRRKNKYAYSRLATYIATHDGSGCITYLAVEDGYRSSLAACLS